MSLIDPKWLEVIDKWFDDPTYKECPWCLEWTYDTKKRDCDNCHTYPKARY